MKIELRKANSEDAAKIFEMQRKAFMPLLEKYKDYETSPANETVERVAARIQNSNYFMIFADSTLVGAIRIIERVGKHFWVSPVFIIPAYQGQGIAQKVMRQTEELFPEAKMWELETILEEKGNCYLYEKLGYTRTSRVHVVNERMTLVNYQKKLEA